MLFWIKCGQYLGKCHMVAAVSAGARWRCGVVRMRMPFTYACCSTAGHCLHPFTDFPAEDDRSAASSHLLCHTVAVWGHQVYSRVNQWILLTAGCRWSHHSLATTCSSSQHHSSITTSRMIPSWHHFISHLILPTRFMCTNRIYNFSCWFTSLIRSTM